MVASSKRLDVSEKTRNDFMKRALRQSLIGTGLAICLLTFDKFRPKNRHLDGRRSVRMALSQSAIDEAKAKVEAIKGKLAEVESIFYPKLTGIAYIAPMYSVRGNAMDDDLSKAATALSDWGLTPTSGHSPCSAFNNIWTSGCQRARCFI